MDEVISSLLHVGAFGTFGLHFNRSCWQLQPAQECTWLRLQGRTSTAKCSRAIGARERVELFKPKDSAVTRRYEDKLAMNTQAGRRKDGTLGHPQCGGHREQELGSIPSFSREMAGLSTWDALQDTVSLASQLQQNV